MRGRRDFRTAVVASAIATLSPDHTARVSAVQEILARLRLAEKEAGVAARGKRSGHRREQ